MTRLFLLFILLPFQVSAAAITNVNLGGIAGQIEYSETQQEIVIQDILNAKLDSFGVKVNMKVYDNEQKLHAAYRAGKIDGIYGDPLVAIPHFDTFQKTWFINAYFSGTKAKHALVMVVRKQSGIKNIQQLKNKKIAFYPQGHLEKMFLETMMFKQKLGSINRFFVKQSNVKDAHKALLDVFFGKSDVTVIPDYVFDTASELNPQLKKKLQPIAKSELMCTRIVVVRDTPKYKAILTSLVEAGKFDTKSDRSDMRFLTLEPTKFKELETVWALAKEHQTLKGDK